MKILVDNGHGYDTAGKCSPDQRIREYAYVREIAAILCEQLKNEGLDAEMIVSEERDITLGERCRRVNNICNKVGKKNVLLVSIHVNAAGKGQWMKARGWCAYTSVGQTSSDKLADCLYAAAEKTFPKGTQIRKEMSDGDPDFEAGFYILKNTACTAVLTENFFQDNYEDVEYLLSKEGRAAIVETHVQGIKQFINTKKK